MKNNNITLHFKFSEFEKSDIAEKYEINNKIPDDHIRWAIRLLVINLLEPLRRAYGKPLHINSGYRCPLVNTLAGGSETSQHLKGEAADIAAEDPLYLAQVVVRNHLPFDQIILYGTFVHLSHKPYGPQRRQILYDKSYMLQYPKSKRL